MVNLSLDPSRGPVHVETRTKVTVARIRKLLNSAADGSRCFPAVGERPLTPEILVNQIFM